MTIKFCHCYIIQFSPYTTTCWIVPVNLRGADSEFLIL